MAKFVQFPLFSILQYQDIKAWLQQLTLVKGNKIVAKTAEQIQVKPTELAYLVLQQAFCMQQFTDFCMIAKQVKDDIKILFCNFLRNKTLSGDKPIAGFVSLIIRPIYFSNSCLRYT